MLFKDFFGDVNDILVTYSSDLYLLQSRIQFHYRDCLPGEIRDNSTKKCIRCLPGRYSLSPYDTECKKCPEGTYDCVGSYLNVSVGYWRRNTTTDKAYSCGALDNKNRSRCEGGYDSHCKSGYMGSLCHQCDITQGFVRTGSETKIECSRCLKSSIPEENESTPSLLMLHLTALFYFLAFLAFEIYFITRAVESGKQYYEAAANNRYHVRTSVGPYLNLIITYFQIISIVSSFEVKTFQYLYNFSSLIGEPASKIFYSLDCIFLYWGLAPENLIKTKIILLVSIPVVKLTVLSIYYLIRGLNKDRKIVIVVAALSFFMFEQPQIIKKLISYVICRKFEADNEDQQSYVQGDEFFVCEGDAYYHFKYAVVLPCLLFFCLLPLALFMVLFIKKRQEKLDTEWMRRGVGVIYNGYTKQAYYWNLVVNFSKIGLIILTQMFIFEPKILVFLLVLWFYLYITLISKIKPYLEHELVNAEKYSLYAYLITVFCSFFMIQDLPLSLQIFCMLIILAVNVIALGYIGKQLYLISKKSAIKEKLKRCAKRIRKMCKRSSTETNDKSFTYALKENLASKSKDLVNSACKEYTLDDLQDTSVNKNTL